jgi:tellurite resistance protein TehA-like permease
MRNLPPAYFALVMATGIVSIAALGFGLPLFATSLFVFNLLAYAVLVLLTLLRATLYPRLLLGELVDHRAGAGFFTIVAASCLIGAQFLLIAGSEAAAVVFLALGAALWAGLTYTIFAVFTIKRDKPPLDRGISGLWLIAVVAVQSVAILSILAAKGWREPGSGELEFFALSMWLWGVMFYIWIITLLFFRYTYFAYSARDVDAPSWINMGAMAISALAGAELVRNAGDAPFVASLLPFLKGFTVFCWAAGTWWIPMLLVLTTWRQFVERTAPHYHPADWAAVFPLGMYAEATRQMAATFDLRFLDFPARIMFVIAATAWALAFLGLLWGLGHALTRHQTQSG